MLESKAEISLQILLMVVVVVMVVRWLLCGFKRL